eukprot:1844359-Pleurochrysis_carterae.AAC.3
MMYKWGHPVATLTSDEGDNTSLPQSDANSANQCLDFWSTGVWPTCYGAKSLEERCTPVRLWPSDGSHREQARYLFRIFCERNSLSRNTNRRDVVRMMVHFCVARTATTHTEVDFLLANFAFNVFAHARPPHSATGRDAAKERVLIQSNSHLLTRQTSRRKNGARRKTSPLTTLTNRQTPHAKDPDSCTLPCACHLFEQQWFLDGVSGMASLNTLLSRSRYLLQCLAFIIAASGRDDYTVVRQLLPKHTTTNNYTVETEAKSPLDHGAAMR